MHFFLTGGGDYSHFSKLENRIKSMLPKVCPTTILPYAAEPDQYKDISEHVVDTFSIDRGRDIYFSENASNFNAEQFERSSFVFIEGGNTFDLVTTVRKANIETYLKSYVTSGNNGIIYADSAGAILLGKSVETAFFGDDADEDSQRLQNFRGLDLLGSWSVHAHYTPADDEAVMSLIYQEGTPVLALCEESGVHLSSQGEISIFGDKPTYIFNFSGRHQLEIGTMHLLSDFY